VIDQIVVFQADCDKIQLKKNSYDVIFVTPNQNFWLRQCLLMRYLFAYITQNVQKSY